MIHSLKSNLLHIFLLTMFAIFLLFPIHTLNGAASGLLLWYNIILPTLLPFIILTSVIIKTQAFNIISMTLGPTIGRLFWVSQEGAFAIIIGFLCGYPMGAKVINDLLETDNISTKEAQYLLSFCNNTSPMFIVSFFILQILEDTSYLPIVLLALYLSPIIMSMFTRRYYKISSTKFIDSTHENNSSHSPSFSFKILDEIIMDSVTLILKIGAYIMLFSIFISLSSLINFEMFLSLDYIIPMLEITNGLELYKTLPSTIYSYLCMIFLVSFGGLCAIGQTKCVITSTKLKIKHYFIQKIITAVIAVIISMILFIIIRSIHH